MTASYHLVVNDLVYEPPFETLDEAKAAAATLVDHDAEPNLQIDVVTPEKTTTLQFMHEPREWIRYPLNPITFSAA